MAITITSPVTKRTFKSNGAIGDIAISGTYTGTPTAIEASFNGGAYATIVASPSGGTYSGTLSSQSVGQGTLTVRFTNDVGENASVTLIGVGYRFAIAGQSNAAGYGNGPNYYYSASGIMPTLFGNDYNWKELLDPSDDATNQVDTVSLDASCNGSAWTILSTYILQATGIPVEFIPCALTSTSIASWQPGTDHQDRATLYGSMVYRSIQSGGVNAVLYWQGEDDALQETTEANYNTAMDSLADAIWTDLGCKLMPCTIFNMDNPPYVADNTAVNNAINTAWGDNSHVLTGPDFADIKASELTGIHFGQPHSYMIAIRWWYALRTALNFTDNIVQSNQYWLMANSVPCSFKKNVTTGNVIVVMIAQYGGTIMGATAISDNHSNTYTLIGSVLTYSGDSALHLGMYYAYNVTGGATTVTFAGADTPSITIVIHEYPGLTTSDPLDKNHGDQATSGTTPNSGNTTATVQAQELLVGAFTPYASTFMHPNPGSNYRLRNVYTDGNFTNIIGTEDRVVSAIDVYNATFTQTYDAGWLAMIATFKIAGPAGTEESVSLGKILKVTQPFSGTEDGTTLTVHKGVSVSEQVIVQGAVSLAKFKSISALTNVNVFDVTSLAKFDGVSIFEIKTFLELFTLTRSGGLTSEGVRAAIEESVILANFKGISALNQLVIGDGATLAKFIGITAPSQVIIEDLATLVRFVGITTTSARPTILETVILLYSADLASEGARPTIEESVTLVKFIGITVVNQLVIGDGITLVGFIGIGATSERPTILETLILSRSNTQTSETQTNEKDAVSLAKFIDITVLEETQGFINETVILARSIAITVLQEGISHVNENISINRLIGINTDAQCQVNDNTVLNRLIGISGTTQCQVNDNLILNRLTEISGTTQCQVNDYFSLAKFIRIIITEETRGQYSESVIFDRFIGLTVLQEGISHVTESVSVNRLNGISIIEQSKVYNSLIFDRLNGITIAEQCQIFNNLIFSKSSGLSIISESIANENITVNKFNGLITNSQIVIPELITLSQLYGLVVFDSRYLLENINLQRNNQLILVDSPTIFEQVELGRIDIATIITVLIGYSNINLNQYKSIIAEPPSLYVYNDGNHSITVLFRDKRASVNWRDKRASINWRDKRSNK